MNEVCPICNGSGVIDVLDYSIGEVVTIPCPDCEGSEKAVKRVQELEQQNKRYREVIRECIERMNEGGTGTRNFVYERLSKALEGE